METPAQMSDQTPETVAISGHGWQALLCPLNGGAIARLDFEGVAVLRPASDEDIAARQIRKMSCFPLAPFSNRIGHGRFDWLGESYDITPDDRGAPHALHGFAWRSAWRVASHTPDSACLTLNHAADPRWPFDCRVTQTFLADPGGFHVTLTLENRDRQPIPAGLGWHPYFPFDETSRLRANVDRVERQREDKLAEAVDAVPEHWRFGEEKQIAPLHVDHCFHGWDGVADITLDGRTVRLSASADLDSLIVFRPPGESFFCVEPVSHGVDAINRDLSGRRPMRTLAPGEEWQVAMTFSVAQPV
jgi:aldose 1-epimerase